MGRGIRTRSTASVDEVFGLRFDILEQTCPDLAADVRALLRGAPLTNLDGVLELSWDPREGGVVSVRRPGEPLVVDLYVAPLQALTLPDPDSRASTPCPAAWRSGSSGTVWELFNCRIDRLSWRGNATS